MPNAIKIYLMEKLDSLIKNKSVNSNKILTKMFLKNIVFLLPISLEGICDIASLNPNPNIAIIPKIILIDEIINIVKLTNLFYSIKKSSLWRFSI